ncbi:branched chain amino acid: 2-keto-4-methylthiobutyrate aminotransferase [Rhodoferax ferrireducens T118]|uniref:Branched chain amino acid: 2-keto-4-methylthiobutyrate aminotransferase n=2 Tax=Rhodoferax ferrireducens TaxID=192843 RepID=Q21Y75_ALBFT|nr:branched chain amino acid: 2-keto-4-methylthiobutyrate aminotransferase [Rhodoferax ferrireducens T118]
MDNSVMNTLPPLPCYLNGEFTELPNAKISVMDRGFIFGDGVYEVVPVYGGQLFRFAQHMARLDRSLAELRIANPLTPAQWAEIAHKLIVTHADSTGASVQNIDQLIYIQITRGVAMRDHVMPTDITPTVFVMINAMKLPSEAMRSQGVACVTADDFRWEKAHIKSTSLLGSVLARQISFDAGATETIMFRDGFLSEAAASNVWVVKGGKVLGTPKDNLVLEGIRYRLIEDICRARGIPFELRRLSREEVRDADELLLSSATKEVLPVTTLDGKPVGQGKPGPVYAQLYAGYSEAKAQSRQSPTA